MKINGPSQICGLLSLLILVQGLNASAYGDAKCTGTLVVESLVQNSKVLPEFAEVSATYNISAFECVEMISPKSAKSVTNTVVLSFAPGVSKEVAKPGVRLNVELRNQLSGMAMFGAMEMEQKWLVLGESK